MLTLSVGADVSCVQEYNIGRFNASISSRIEAYSLPFLESAVSVQGLLHQPKDSLGVWYH